MKPISQKGDIVAEANGIIRELRKENKRLKKEVFDDNKLIKQLSDNCEEEVKRRLKNVKKESQKKDFIKMIDKKWTFFEDDLPHFQKGDVFIAKREWDEIKNDALCVDSAPEDKK